jgi:hypothetical protein
MAAIALIMEARRIGRIKENEGKENEVSASTTDERSTPEKLTKRSPKTPSA